jgi:hypothetical protein
MLFKVGTLSYNWSLQLDHEESTNIKGLEDVWRQMSRVVKKSDYGERMKMEDIMKHETIVSMMSAEGRGRRICCLQEKRSVVGVCESLQVLC